MQEIKNGEVPWSRTIRAAMDAIQLWKTVYSRKHGTRVSTRFISRLEQKKSIQNSLRHTKQEVKEHLNQAYRRYYALKKNALHLRETWLRDLAAMKAKEDGGDQETIYNNLLHRESQQRSARRL